MAGIGVADRLDAGFDYPIAVGMDFAAVADSAVVEGKIGQQGYEVADYSQIIDPKAGTAWFGVEYAVHYFAHCLLLSAQEPTAVALIIAD